jgi:hypothetical protein
MKKFFRISVFLLAILVLGVGQLVAAERGKGFSRRGGSAESHMSERGKENTNAQWYADPDRGWVRAEERKENKKDSRAADKGRGRDRDRDR